MKQGRAPYRARLAFTIVELLIVIVVIGILAALVISTYSSAQERARTAKITADLTALKKAVVAARESTGGRLRDVTGNSATAGGCVYKASGTDLATLPSTDGCWTSYTSALDRISIASGSNVRGLKDPWGRPYYIDENEWAQAPDCGKDLLGTYRLPHVYDSWSPLNPMRISSASPGC